jgi:hypothetical protein
VNEESQQSRACGALYFVVTFLRTNFWQTEFFGTSPETKSKMKKKERLPKIEKTS